MLVTISIACLIFLRSWLISTMSHFSPNGCVRLSDSNEPPLFGAYCKVQSDLKPKFRNRLQNFMQITFKNCKQNIPHVSKEEIMSARRPKPRRDFSTDFTRKFGRYKIRTEIIPPAGTMSPARQTTRNDIIGIRAINDANSGRLQLVHLHIGM